MPDMLRLFIIIFFLPSLIFAQNKKIDSLRNVISKMPDDTGKVNELNQLNKMLWQDGDYNGCLQNSLLTIGLAKKLNFRKGEAAGLGNLGVAYKNKGNYPKALECYFEALKIDEKLKDRSGMAKRLNNIGLLYSNQGDNEKSLKYYEQALAIDKKLGNKAGMATRFGNIGAVYYDSGNYPRAMDYYLEALKLDEEAGNRHGVAKNLGSIGNLYATQGDSAIAKGNTEFALKNKFVKAGEYYEKALRIYEAAGDKIGMSIFYGNIGQLNSRFGNYAKAEQYIKKALDIAYRMEDLYLVKDQEEFLSSLYEKTGKPEEALLHYKNFVKTRDSIFNEETTKKQVRSEMNYEFEKKEAAAKLEQEKREAIAAAESKKQKIILMAISGFGVLILAFAIFAYRSFLQKKKANVEISEQKHIIEEKQKEILDSIHYAKRIQQSLMPNEIFIARKLKELQK